MARHIVGLLIGLWVGLNSFELCSQTDYNTISFFPKQEYAIYQSILRLELDQASSDLDRLQEENALRLFLRDYIDFLKIFLNQETAKIEAYEAIKNSRLEKIEHFDDESSPLYSYIIAEINLHWTLIYIQNQSYWKGYTHAKRAYKLLTKNQQAFPGFIPNYKSLGILHAAIGSVPDPYHGLFTFFSGMKGTMDQGKSEIQRVLSHIESNPQYAFKEETVVLYALFMLHLGNEGEAAWQTLQKVSFLNEGSPLVIFCEANIAMHTGRNDVADQLISSFSVSPKQYPFYYLDFMRGLVLLRKLDSSCAPYFQHYIQKMQGKNYVKESLQKLAWSRLIVDDVPGYKNFIYRIGLEGSTSVDGDRNAQKEYEETREGEIPDDIFLKSRLLFDGGYFQKALDLLDQNNHYQNSSLNTRIEYNYRLGRIYHELRELPQALHFYQITIDQGRAYPEYFACNAALQMGLIYESLGNKVLAQKYFALCLEIRPDNYRQSLHLKARAGMNRI